MVFKFTCLGVFAGLFVVVVTCDGSNSVVACFNVGKSSLVWVVVIWGLFVCLLCTVSYSCLLLWIDGIWVSGCDDDELFD